MTLYGRTDNPSEMLHALTGYMMFDKDDIAWLMREGGWDSVVLHEMGHVLGIGSLWDDNNLAVVGRDDYYGPNAAREWRDMGCNYHPPVETHGSSGTRGVHWDEACLAGEQPRSSFDHSSPAPQNRF